MSTHQSDKSDYSSRKKDNDDIPDRHNINPEKENNNFKFEEQYLSTESSQSTGNDSNQTNQTGNYTSNENREKSYTDSNENADYDNNSRESDFKYNSFQQKKEYEITH